MQDLSVRMSASGSCVGSLVEDLCMGISCTRCLRSPQQNPVEGLVQDRCMRISCARCLRQDLLSRTTCARSLYADLLCISLCQDLCIGILYDHLCKISVCGSLVQDLSVRMSAAGSCRTTCARSLHQISDLGSLHQDLCRTTCRRLSSRLHKRNCTSIPRDGHAGSPQRVALRHQKSQLYQHFARWTRAISAEGCISKSEIAISPAFRKKQFHLHSAHSTRTISAEGCTSKPKNALSPAFRALDTRDLRRGFTFRNHASGVLRLPRNHEPRSYEMLHWPRKSIPKLKFQKCNPSQE